MARTQLTTTGIRNVQRNDLDITTTGEAVVARLIAGTNITFSSTGVDAGTGDVTINASSSGGSNWTITGSDIYRNSKVTVNSTTAPVVGLDVYGQTRVAASSGMVGAPGDPSYALSVQNNAVATWIEILNNGGTGKGAFFGMTNNSFQQWNFQGGPITFHTNPTVSVGTLRMAIAADGTVAINDLGGTGTRMVVASPAGVLSTQAIPGGGSGTPGGSNGHVQFNDSGTFGGDPALFWDNTNDRLGIGIPAPQAPLHIYKEQNSATTLRIQNNSALPAAQSNIELVSDLSLCTFFKVSSTYAGYKNIGINDFGLYNYLGNIAFTNDDATGNISFCTGGSTTSDFTITDSALIVKSLDTDLTAPTQTGTIRMVTTDSTGKLSHQPIPGTGGGGSVTGTGAPGRVAVWDAATNLTGDATFTFDGQTVSIAGVSSNYSLNINNFGIQSFSPDYTLTSRNVRYNGSTWQYLTNGYAMMHYYNLGNIAIYGAAENTSGPGAAASVDFLWNITHDGWVTMAKYGTGTKTGTAISALGVDSTGLVLNIPLGGGGGIAGSGTSGQVTYWNGTSSITGSANMTFNGTTLNVAGSTTARSISVNNFGIASPDTDTGVVAQNLYFNGGWKYVGNGYGSAHIHLGDTLYTATAPNNAAGPGAPATISLVGEVLNSGQMKFSKYGVGTFTGTAARTLQVDSGGYIIEGPVGGGGGGVTTMAPVGSTPNADAGTITGTTLTLQPADETNPGVVTIDAQAFTGEKTFIDGIITDQIFSISGDYLALRDELAVTNYRFTYDNSTSAANFSVGPLTADRTYTLPNNSGTIALLSDIVGGGTPGGADGQVQYNNGGVFGGDGAFNWDDTNKRLGIGTAAPAASFHITSAVDGSSGMFVDNTSAGASAISRILIRNNAGESVQFAIDGSGVATNSQSYVSAGKNLLLGVDHATASGGTSKFQIYTGGYSNAANPKFTIDSVGNVGIGTTTPATTLHISSHTPSLPTIVTGNMLIQSMNDGMGVFSNNMYYAGATPSRYKAGPAGYLYFSDGVVYLGNAPTGAAASAIDIFTSWKLLIEQSGNTRIASLDTDLTAPTQTGTIRMVTTDSNGLLSHQAIPSGGGGGITTVSNVGYASNNQAAIISGSDLQLQVADAGFPGVVSTVAQSFGGEKTFTSFITVDANYFSNGSAAAMLRLYRRTSNPAIDNIGATIEFYVENSGGTAPYTGAIKSVLYDVTGASGSSLDFTTINGAGTPVTPLRLTADTALIPYLAGSGTRTLTVDNAGVIGASAGGGGGVTTMAPIGAVPNADGASISGSTLTLQPASTSFGGVVTTGDQTFTGIKTFENPINLGAGGSLTPSTVFPGYFTAPGGGGFMIAGFDSTVGKFVYATGNVNYTLSTQTLDVPTLKVTSLDTDLTPPAQTGTIRVVTTDNTGLLSSIPMGGNLLNVRFLTSGTTYTPTAGTARAVLHLIGGGGGGGGTAGVASGSGAGAGGGAGAYVIKQITGITGTYTYAIGGAGNAGAATSGTGGTGGNTTFINPVGPVTYTANGGVGGVGSAAVTTATFTVPVLGGNGGAATNGDVNIAGEGGGVGMHFLAATSVSGAGGSSNLGSGGKQLISTASTAGVAGSGYGGGGGGGVSSGNTNAAGGAGATGAIVIYEYR